MQKTILMIVAALVGCGESEAEKAAKLKAAAEAKAAAPLMPLLDIDVTSGVVVIAGQVTLAPNDLEAAEAKAEVKTTAEEKPLIADAIVEKAIRSFLSLNKPKGELTKADLGKVKVLYLTETQITNAGLKEVAKLKQLTFLELQDTKITDAGLKEVAKLQKLKKLFLYDTQITDVGLKEVAKMKQLRVLGLYATKVAKAGVAQLQKALPKCRIYSNAAK